MKTAPLASLITLTLLPFASNLSASELSCFVKREMPKKPSVNAPFISGSYMDTRFSKAELGELRIIQTAGKAPVLKTPRNKDKPGTVKVDPLTQRYTYRFEPLIDFKAGVYWSDIECGEFGPVYEDNCFDTRTTATVVYDAQSPENSAITIKSERRTHTKALGINLAGLNAWKSEGEYTHPLTGCEVTAPNQPSTRPVSCETAADTLDTAPLGSRCMTTANAAIYEKVTAPDGASAAWKGPDGLIWSQPIGTYASRAEAVSACAEIHAELPTTADFANGQLNNFEDVIGFSRFGVWGKYGYKHYWVNSDYFFQYSDHPAGDNRFDAVFGVAKGFGAGHGIIDDTKTSFEGLPYGAVCVWRAKN